MFKMDLHQEPCPRNLGSPKPLMTLIFGPKIEPILINEFSNTKEMRSWVGTIKIWQETDAMYVPLYFYIIPHVERDLTRDLELGLKQDLKTCLTTLRMCIYLKHKRNIFLSEDYQDLTGKWCQVSTTLFSHHTTCWTRSYTWFWARS